MTHPHHDPALLSAFLRLSVLLPTPGTADADAANVARAMSELAAAINVADGADAAPPLNDPPGRLAEPGEDGYFPKGQIPTEADLRRFGPDARWARFDCSGETAAQPVFGHIRWARAENTSAGWCFVFKELADDVVGYCFARIALAPQVQYILVTANDR